MKYLIENLNSSKNRMDNNYFLRIKYLVETTDITLIDIKNLDKYTFNKNDTVIIGVLSLSILMKKTLKDNLIEVANKYIMIEDCHPWSFEGGHNGLTNFIKKYSINIISTYNSTRETGLIKQSCPNLNFYHVPHHISNDIYKDYGLEKDIDILMYGNTEIGIYPLRLSLIHI